MTEGRVGDPRPSSKITDIPHHVTWSDEGVIEVMRLKINFSGQTRYIESYNINKAILCHPTNRHVFYFMYCANFFNLQINNFIDVAQKTVKPRFRGKSSVSIDSKSNQIAKIKFDFWF